MEEPNSVILTNVRRSREVLVGNIWKPDQRMQSTQNEANFSHFHSKEIFNHTWRLRTVKSEDSAEDGNELLGNRVRE